MAIFLILTVMSVWLLSIFSHFKFIMALNFYVFRLSFPQFFALTRACQCILQAGVFKKLINYLCPTNIMICSLLNISKQKKLAKNHFKKKYVLCFYINIELVAPHFWIIFNHFNGFIMNFQFNFVSMLFYFLPFYILIGIALNFFRSSFSLIY